MNVARTIDGLVDGLGALRVELGVAVEVLEVQRHRLDSWPAGGDDPKVAGGDDSTSIVERAVIARSAIDLRLTAYGDELDAIRLVIRNLRRDCAADVRRQGAAFAIELPPPRRCSAEGRQGSIQWGDPTCTKVASRGPLCDACSKREWRWRVRHGLRPRPDGVFAGDLT